MKEKIKILLVNFSDNDLNSFSKLLSKDLYDMQNIQYTNKTLLSEYQCDLIIISNKENNMDFDSLFKNHNNDFFINIALFLYGNYADLYENHIKYFDDIISPDNNDHVIKAKIFNIIKYYLKLNDAKAQNKFAIANFDDIYETKDCKVALIGNDSKIFHSINEAIKNKINIFDFLEFRNYYDDFLKNYPYNFDLIFLHDADSIHQLVYLCSQIKAHENLKNAHIVFIKKPTDLIFDADIINIGINNYIYYPIKKQELIAQLIVQLKNKKHFDSFDDSFSNSAEYAWKDPLTDLFNKRYLNFFLENYEKTGNFNREIGFMIIDCNNFKEINDRLGHAAGDRILEEFASILKKNFDEHSVVARFGGDEFCAIIFFNQDESQDEKNNLLAKLANSIKTGAKSVQLTPESSSLSVSVGWTISNKNDLIIDLISRADRNMYRDKRQ